MKVMMINGSRREKGCTYTALGLVGESLSKAGIDFEIVHVGADGALEHAQELASECAGLVIGTPVYYAGASGEVEMFCDRLFWNVGRKALRGKPCAVLASARRAGTTCAIDDLAKYPSIVEMPIVTSCYWPMVHGNSPEEVMRDEEGVQVMRRLGENMAWILKCIEAAGAAGIERPAPIENEAKTNFIR